MTSEEVFDKFAERYDSWYERPFGSSVFRIEKACISTLCEGLKGPYLEVGVGTGRFSKALGIEYGLDTSMGVLKLAKGRGITVVQGAGESLPFRDGCFGAVFIIVTICFVREPLKVLREASRVLRDDGSVILGLIPRESPWAAYYIKKGEAGNVFYKIARFYSRDELEEMLSLAGLRITRACSTLFHEPTEEPVEFEPPKEGLHLDAGFVSLIAKKVSNLQKFK